VKSIQNDDWVIAISESTKNDLCNLTKLEPERVFVTLLAASDLFYHCIDASLQRSVRKKYGIPDSKYVLSLSTLEPRKNIDHTIRCFINMIQQQNIHDLNLVLVGTKGWDFEKIFSEVRYSGVLCDKIIITGFVDDYDLAPLYSGATMFVYPSFYEGFGLPVLEAMQCGVPVVTSNTSSLPEVVGDAGFLLDPRDSNSLCQCMLNIYNDPALAKKMSLKSISRAKMFSWKRCGEQTIAAYKYACNN
jgi:glycosyltransferase involved in cell wall biosynthesis